MLGSSWPASWTGWVATAAWSKLLPFALLGFVVASTRRLPLVPALAIVGTTVFATEWLVSHASLGVPWALVGHSQLSVPGVAQLAVVGGVPLVSAFVVVVGLALARALLDRRRETFAVAMGGVAAWCALALGGVGLAEAMRPVARGEAQELLIVQPALPRGERWGDDLQPANLMRVRAFVGTLPEEEIARAAALVLPENLLTAPVDATPALEAQLEAWSAELGKPLLTGLAMASGSRHPDRYRSSVVWIGPEGDAWPRLDKERAVPVVESGRALPGARALAGLFGSAADWKKVEEVPDGGRFDAPLPVVPALCYEALFPGLVSERRGDASVAILNLADDSWVSGDAATRQLTAFAAFRAIEQRLPLVRVAHGGLSVVVDPYGRIVLSLPLDAYAWERVTVRPEPPPGAAERAAVLALPLLVGVVVAGFAAGFPGPRQRVETPRG